MKTTFGILCFVAAALLGARSGAQGIPERWASPIHEMLETYVIGYERIELTQLVEWTAGWGERARGSA